MEKCDFIDMLILVVRKSFEKCGDYFEILIYFGYILDI